MNIDTIHGYNPNLKRNRLSMHKVENPHSLREKTIVGLCEKNNRGNNIAFSGSIQSKSVAAANGFFGKLFESKTFGNFLEYSHKHNIATSALIALALAGVMRPATILALPGDKDKDDKIYAAAQAVATGVIGFLASWALTSPLDGALNKLYDNKKDFFGSKTLKKIQEGIDAKEALKKAGTLDEAGKEALNALYKKKAAIKTLAKNIPDWIIAVPRATLTIALIPPILKYVFGVEKKKKPVQPNNNQQPVETKLANNTNNVIPSNMVASSAFKDYGFGKGGNK